MNPPHPPTTPFSSSAHCIFLTIFIQQDDKDGTQTCLSTCRIVSWQLNSTSSINKFTSYDLIVLKCFKNHSEISVGYFWRRGKIKHRFTSYLHQEFSCFARRSQLLFCTDILLCGFKSKTTLNCLNYSVQGMPKSSVKQLLFLSTVKSEMESHFQWAPVVLRLRCETFVNSA